MKYNVWNLWREDYRESDEPQHFSTSWENESEQKDNDVSNIST